VLTGVSKSLAAGMCAVVLLQMSCSAAFTAVALRMMFGRLRVCSLMAALGFEILVCAAVRDWVRFLLCWLMATHGTT
jgi:hypothetical protein